MIQEYLFELDSKTAAQVITVIGGQASVIHYLLPGISANKWGLQCRESAQCYELGIRRMGSRLIERCFVHNNSWWKQYFAQERTLD